MLIFEVLYNGMLMFEIWIPSYFLNANCYYFIFKLIDFTFMFLTNFKQNLTWYIYIFFRPLYLLELSIGQFSSSGCVKIWDLAPGFRGIGYGQSLATFIVCCYYCALIGISCYYLFASMQAVLPWTVCHLELAEAGKLCLPSNSNRYFFYFNKKKIFVSYLIFKSIKIDKLSYYFDF